MPEARPSLVLASASPRRRALLARLTTDVTVRPADIDERVDGDRLETSLATLALDKARAAGRGCPDVIVLAADTVVVVDGEVLGKPAGDAEARAMLETLAGREHRVLTAVAVLDTRTGRSETRVVTSRVTMKRYDAAAIRDYVRSGEPLDKAGAYAVQGLGGRLIDAVTGSYSNVVGLPLEATRELLRAFGVAVTPAASSEAPA